MRKKHVVFWKEYPMKAVQRKSKRCRFHVCVFQFESRWWLDSFVGNKRKENVRKKIVEFLFCWKINAFYWSFRKLKCWKNFSLSKRIGEKLWSLRIWSKRFQFSNRKRIIDRFKINFLLLSNALRNLPYRSFCSWFKNNERQWRARSHDSRFNLSNLWFIKLNCAKVSHFEQFDGEDHNDREMWCKPIKGNIKWMKIDEWV